VPLHISLFGAVGAAATVALMPGPSAGPELAFGARVNALSIEASARAETTVGEVRTASGDRVDATVLSGAIAPCAHLEQFAGCVVGRMGAFQGHAPDVVHPTLGTSAFAAIGLRATYLLAIGARLGLRGALEGGLPLVRTTLAIDAAPIWTAPAAFVGVSVATVVRFM
jgi:hypothetical protein